MNIYIKIIYHGKGYNENGNIIYELKNGNGKVKEYYDWNGKLEFEGEYLNGKRHGKGKKYYNGELIFEGEYLYGYRFKGKYYINERLEYEGEYLFYNKFNGKGFDEYGNIIYELKNGNGKVKEYYDDGKLKYEGEYLNGKSNGKGKEYDEYRNKINKKII